MCGATMEKNVSKPLLMMCLGLLSACSTVGPVANRFVGLGQASPAPSATGAFDGSYFGTVHTVRADMPAGCAADKKGVVQVGDRRVAFAYAPDVPFNATVQADGAFHDDLKTQNGNATMSGKIEKDALAMVIVTPHCETHYALSLIGNRS